MIKRSSLLAAALVAAAPFSQAQAQAPVVTAEVRARAETVPVGTTADDAADDPAIWLNRRDPAASLIVATDKKAGLYVYGMDGKVRHFVADGRLNNVDLVDMGRAGIMVVASDRNDETAARLRLYRLDTAAAQLVPVAVFDGGAGEAYGVCLVRRASGFDAFSVLKDGLVAQVQVRLRLDLARQIELPALARLSLPEEVRGRVRGGTSSTTQFMPVIERTLSRISVAQLDAFVRIGGAAVDQHGRHFLARFGLDGEGGDVAGLKPGSCSTAHSMSCGQWFLPLMMIMSLARPTMNR
jgi:hypothetical protein